MGIAYSNLNQYEDSIKAYIKTLYLNPNAKHVWGYLRTALISANMLELASETSNEELESLANRFNVTFA